VAARLMQRLEDPIPCIFISPPTAMFAFPSMKRHSVLAITGEADQFCSIPTLETLLDKDRIFIVKDVDHFWFGEEDRLVPYLKDKLELINPVTK